MPVALIEIGSVRVRQKSNDCSKVSGLAENFGTFVDLKKSLDEILRVEDGIANAISIIEDVVQR